MIFFPLQISFHYICRRILKKTTFVIIFKNDLFHAHYTLVYNNHIFSLNVFNSFVHEFLVSTSFLFNTIIKGAAYDIFKSITRYPDPR